MYCLYCLVKHTKSNTSKPTQKTNSAIQTRLRAEKNSKRQWIRGLRKNETKAVNQFIEAGYLYAQAKDFINAKETLLKAPSRTFLDCSYDKL